VVDVGVDVGLRQLCDVASPDEARIGRQVALIGLQRVGGDTALDRQPGGVLG